MLRVQVRQEREGGVGDRVVEVDEILKDLNSVLFEEDNEGFHGNELDYYDPRNSYLHQA